MSASKLRSRQPRGRRPQRNPYAELIQTLNRRYHEQWVRAEGLQSELDRWHRSLLGRMFRGLQGIKRRLWPARLASNEPVPQDWAPYQQSVPAVPDRATVSVIVPFKDRVELLRNCLRSLRRTRPRPLEVILVDNGSTEPKTLRYLATLQRYAWIRTVESPGAFNFSRLCNAGTKASTGEQLLFLNNDTEIIHRDWLTPLQTIIADPAVGIVGGTLLYPNGTIQHAGLFPNGQGLWFHPYRGQRIADPDTPSELHQARVVPAVTAACLLIRRKLYDEIGGFDERFPIAYNDVDLCQRVRERGLSVVVTPHTRLIHYEGLSRGYGIDNPHPIIGDSQVDIDAPLPEGV